MSLPSNKYSHTSTDSLRRQLAERKRVLVRETGRIMQMSWAPSQITMQSFYTIEQEVIDLTQEIKLRETGHGDS